MFLQLRPWGIAAFLPLVTLFGASPARAEPASAETKGEVVLLGSSSINDSFGHLVAEELQREGYRVLRRGYAAAGLSRPDFRDMIDQISDVPIGKTTVAVLLYLGGNDAQALWLKPEERMRGRDAWIKWDEDRWADVYEARAEELMNRLCDRGARNVIVLPPADVVSAKMQRRLDRIRKLQEDAARASKCGKFVSTAGDAGQLAAPREPLRAADGAHLTRSGAVRVWNRVSQAVLRIIASRE